ncbi:MAG TPA: hypothetical protein ENN11_01125 [Methanomicrobia archaeon]|nr:hypothetical protein [Methanomicrobia archaeon]
MARPTVLGKQQPPQSGPTVQTEKVRKYLHYIPSMRGACPLRAIRISEVKLPEHGRHRLYSGASGGTPSLSPNVY